MRTIRQAGAALSSWLAAGFQEPVKNGELAGAESRSVVSGRGEMAL
ncbi:MAG: hypothetical protein J4G03_08635 [Gemmatimonadetes bacterium]|nr:hypothetical protein [Gemmatimonadota bacterium]